jgi:dethiobiotin synthetase
VTEEQTMADLARALAYPLVIVARATLGTNNHTLLTIEAARRRGLRVAAVLLNQAAPAHADDASVATNAEQIARFGRVEPIISIPFLQHHDLLEIAEFRRIDWFALAQANSDAG